MSGLNIQKPCDNCELKSMLETEIGIEALALEGLYMAVVQRDSLFGCKHPWRLLYRAYDSNPTESQEQILSKVVEVRGKNPEEYGLPIINEISTLDL